mgnify:CR=1 FL=1
MDTNTLVDHSGGAVRTRWRGLGIQLVGAGSSPLTPSPRIGGGGPDMKAWGIIALVVAGLYWLQAVLIPLALAVLLTFLLSPVVSTLQRRGLGRVPSVLVTVLLALSILGGIGWTLTRQVVTLADELPRYSLNIRQRIADLRGASKGGSVEKVQKAVEDVVGEIQKTDAPSVTPQKPPLAVVLESPSILVHLPNLLHALAGAGVVTVLVIFMLLERLELRDRVILLIGYRRMTATTRRARRSRGAYQPVPARAIPHQRQFRRGRGTRPVPDRGSLRRHLGSLAAALRFIPYLGHSSRCSCRSPSVWRCSRGGSSRRWLSVCSSCWSSSPARYWSRGCTVKVPGYRRSRS